MQNLDDRFRPYGPHLRVTDRSVGGTSMPFKPCPKPFRNVARTSLNGNRVSGYVLETPDATHAYMLLFNHN